SAGAPLAASAGRRADRASVHHRAPRLRGSRPSRAIPCALWRAPCRTRAHAALGRHAGRIAGWQGHRFRRQVLPVLVAEAKRLGAHRRDGGATARVDRVSSARWDAVVVGAGPNGLMAAITLGRAGMATLLLEAERAPGGACKSAALTLPGYT